MSLAPATAPAHGWDPRSCGARCDECPLGPNGFLHDRSRPWAPVPGEFHAGARTLAVAEMPADDETKHGHPFAGASGSEWNATLESVGRGRVEVDIDNVIACQPHGAASGAYERLTAAITKENKRRAEAGLEPVVHPAEACRPRLLGVVARYRDVIALGGTAAKALLSTEQGIFALRGGPVEVPSADGGEPRRILPTFHPAFVLRSASWREVLRADVAKAFRWFENRRNWIEPEMILRPSVEQVRAWLAQPAQHGFWTDDTETDSKEPLTAKVRCVGVARIEPTARILLCEQCRGSKRWIQRFDDDRGWVPSPAEWHGNPCPRCQGRGVREVDASTIVIPFLGIDGTTRFYTAAEEEELKALLRWHLTEASRLKVGHNAGSYDRIVYEQFLRVTPTPRHDTLFPARFVAPDRPKALGVVGSIYTDVHAWKADNEGKKIAYAARSDHQLWHYCGLDCVVNAKVFPPLWEGAARVGALRPLREDIRPKSWPATRPWVNMEVDHFAQEWTVEAHYLGMFVDQKARARHESRLVGEIAKWKAVAQRYAHEQGVTGKVTRDRHGNERRVDLFNPGSDDQVASLIFDRWEIVPTVFSEQTDKPSTKDEVLRGILTSENLPKDRWVFLDAIRRYRRARKALSTFVIPARLTSADPEHGLVWPDGRMRSSWAAHTTSVARYASREPNMQNVPIKYRDMYTASPGNVLIGGDVDQFHLRIIANRWRVGRLLQAFHDGIDPHSSLALDFFGATFRHANGWGPDGFSLKKKPEKGSDADKMRNMGKVIRYQGAYWDVPAGIHKSVIKVEDADGNLPFAHLTEKEIRKYYRIWMRAEPEWEAAWEWCMNTYQANGGWIEECIMGRRSSDLEAGKRQAVVNYDILACEPAIMRLVECNVRDAFPFMHDGPNTGMVHQGHDATNVETKGRAWIVVQGGKSKVVCDEATERKRQLLEECMTVRIPGWEIPITSEAKVGPNFDEHGQAILSNWKAA